MNELPNARSLGDAYAEHQARAAAQVGINAVEHELFNETTDTVEIAVYVNGRMIHTKSDSQTVQRILRILTGFEQ